MLLASGSLALQESLEVPVVSLKFEHLSLEVLLFFSASTNCLVSDWLLFSRLKITNVIPVTRFPLTVAHADELLWPPPPSEGSACFYGMSIPVQQCSIGL
ncbi:hypothetical protein Tco_1309685 [Tanacetum coccineum]